MRPIAGRANDTERIPSNGKEVANVTTNVLQSGRTKSVHWHGSDRHLKANKTLLAYGRFKQKNGIRKVLSDKQFVFYTKICEHNLAAKKM